MSVPALTDISRLPIRTGILACIFVLPGVRFLLANHYGLLSPEAGLFLGILLLGCFGLASIARNGKVFGVLMLASILFMSAEAVRWLLEQSLGIPGLRMRYGLAAILSVLLPAMYWMRRRFFLVVFVYAIGALGADVIQAFVEREQARTAALAVAPATPLPHVLYLILDEHIGMAGWPEDIPESRSARAAVEKTLQQGSFEIYPNAYANYNDTVNSLSSIFNFKTLTRSLGLVHVAGGHHILGANLLAEEYVRQGYRLNVYRSDYLTIAPRRTPPNRRMVYPANSIYAVKRTPLTPWQKTRQILLSFIQSDPFLSSVQEKALPRTLGFEVVGVGPLAVADIWPDRLTSEIVAAREKTLFLVHLLTPHYPYVYRKDGSVRPPEEWGRSHRTYDRAVYTEAQREYAEQVEFLAGQLHTFFLALKSKGLYARMTIIVHGDHGSRIRLYDSSQRAAREALAAGPFREHMYENSFDYTGAPQLDDLLSRFSALLAIKRPYASEAVVNPRKVSVMRFMAETVCPRGVQLGPEADAVYLFDAQRRPRAIPILDYWNDGSTSAVGATQ